MREFAAADETRRKRRELAHGKTREQSADEHTSERELTFRTPLALASLTPHVDVHHDASCVNRTEHEARHSGTANHNVSWRMGSVL